MPSDEVDVLVQRQFTNAQAGCGKDCISQSRGGRWDTRLTDAANLVGVGERPNLDQRRLVQPHALESVVVRLLSDPVDVRQLGINRMAEPPDDAALDLIVEVLRVQNLADLDGDKNFVDSDTPWRIRNFDHLGGGHAKRQCEGDATPAILAEVTSPTRHLTNGLENLARGLVPAEPQPFLQRVRAGGMDELIEKAVV